MVKTVNFKRGFDVFDFLQKMNEGIRLYYYNIQIDLFSFGFFEEIEDTKEPFRNYLTFNSLQKFEISHLAFEDGRKS